MPVRDTVWPSGTPCWVDYAAADVSDAQRFYSRVIGWDYTDSNSEFGGYCNALTNGRSAAGMMPLMDAAQSPAWTTYFASDDVAATGAAITAAGGTIVGGPHQVGTLGWMLVATDPQGASFGVWQAADHIGAEIYNEPGSLVWNEAAMSDPQTARTFYSAVFGVRFEVVDGMSDYTTFSAGDGPLGGLTGLGPGAPEGWQVCFSVVSADDAVAAAEAESAKIITPATDMPFGRYAVIADPWDAPFSVMQELSAK